MQKIILFFKVKFMLCAVIMIMYFCGAAVAMAKDDTIEMAQMSCKHLNELDGENSLFMMTWLYGYVTAKQNSGILKASYFIVFTKQVVEYCQKNSDKMLGDALQWVMVKYPVPQ